MRCYKISTEFASEDFTYLKYFTIFQEQLSSWYKKKTFNLDSTQKVTKSRRSAEPYIQFPHSVLVQKVE